MTGVGGFALGRRRVLVVDDSPAIRETMVILLGADYEVGALTSAEYLSAGISSHALPDVLVIGASAETRAAAQTLPDRVAVLWLVDEPETPPEPTPAGGHTMPRHFLPEDLRRRIATLTSHAHHRDPSRQLPDRLRPPHLPPEAVGVINQALACELPLLLCGEPGTGKRTLALAIHAARSDGPFVATTANTLRTHPLDTRTTSPATLFISAVEQLSEDGQERLVCALQPNGLVRSTSGASMRLITAASCGPETMLHGPNYSRDLYYRLSVLTARLPPLRDRSADIPEIVRRLADELAYWLHQPTVSFTPQALDRLSNYQWFGNVAELEAVLTRTLSIGGTVIDADDLLFDSMRVPSQQPIDRPTHSTFGAARRLAAAQLDLIINELAHEFKNPLMTIKTFAQHLQRAVQDGENEQVAHLTEEAVDQMDHTLENLLQFTRLNAPVRGSCALPTVLTPVLTQLSKGIGARGIQMEQKPIPAVNVLVDKAQIVYGLQNLFRAVVRPLGSDDQITIDYRAPTTIVVRVSGRGSFGNGPLSSVLDTPSTAESALPVGVAIASAVLERNGGFLALERDRNPAIITVRLAAADAAVAANE